MRELALHGKTPVIADKAQAWPIWDEREEKNLLRALEAGEWGTLGSQVRMFSRRFADYIGVKHCICVNSGAQGLEILLRGAGIGYGDEVVAPSYAYAAAASAIAMVGAAPVFADIEADTGCIDPESVDRSITASTKAILAVHFAGRPCDMDALKAIASRRGVLLLEDASHAYGSKWRGKRAGSLAHGAVFGCQHGMDLTAGEGGLIVTDDEELYAGCWHFHNSGRSLESSSALGGRVLMGTNGRMSEWAAAILDAQLNRLDEMRKLREKNAALLLKRLRALKGLLLPKEDSRITENNRFLLPLRILPDVLGMTRNAFMATVNARGVPLFTGHAPMHSSPMLTSSVFAKSTGKRVRVSETHLPRTDHWREACVYLPGRALLTSPAGIERISDSFEMVVRRQTEAC